MWFAEVEKQLQGGTPQLPYKKPHAGSTGNIHGLVEQMSAAESSKLSTFAIMPTSSKGALVQLRRTTNKRGKQAPAPPKRTRLAYKIFHLSYLSLFFHCDLCRVN